MNERQIVWERSIGKRWIVTITDSPQMDYQQAMWNAYYGQQAQNQLAAGYATLSQGLGVWQTCGQAYGCRHE